MPRVIAFIPGYYTIASFVKKSFEDNGYSVETFDLDGLLSSVLQYGAKIIDSLPFHVIRTKARLLIQRNFYNALKDLKLVSGDICIIYNSGLFGVEALKFLRESSVRIIVLLGDSPYYSKPTRSAIEILEYADRIYCPDSTWKKQLELIDINRIVYFNFPSSLSTGDIAVERQINVIYVGNNYRGSWGYAKAKYLANFSGFGLHLYAGRNWSEYYEKFPSLSESLKHEGFISNDKLGYLYTISKATPIDANPGLINGIHIRVSEALSCGCLPILQDSDDVNDLFGDLENFRAIKTSKDIKEYLNFVLNNEEERVQLVKEMKKRYFSKYNSETFFNSVNELL